MNRDFPAVRLLLAAERTREKRRSDTHRLIGPALALGNLFLLGYAERFLRDDPAILSPLLAADMALLLLLSASTMLGGASVALERTAIFPLRSLDRYLYLFAGTLRSMPVFLWSGATLLAFAILYHGSVAEAVAIPLLLALLILTAESWLASLHLFLRRIRAPRPWLFAAALLVIPPAHLTARGIAGIIGRSWDAAAAAGILLALLALSFRAARRAG